MNKIPITIGVVGHKDAIITNEHKEKIKKIFNDASEKYPESPVVLFSQLALGADTEVAQLFLDLRDKEKRDYRLVVPVPYEMETYKKIQFSSTGELANFNELLGRAERSFELKNNPVNKDMCPLKPKDDAAEKNEYYRKGGEFVADSSVILIALWNENENEKKGGSADTVRYKIEGSYRDEIKKHIFDDKGSLIGIPCNRERMKDKKEIILKNNYLEELLKNKSVKKALDKIETLNKTFKKVKKVTVKKSSECLYPSDKIIDQDGTLLISQNSALLKDYYVISDTHAARHQKIYSRVLTVLFVLGFFIFTFFEAYTNFGFQLVLLYIMLAFLALSIGVFLFIKQFKKSHKKYIEDRVLAEALRVQFYWNLRGIKLAVSKHVLRIHKTEYSWIKHILLAIYGYTYPPLNSEPEVTKNIKDYWIDNQMKYFKGNALGIKKRCKKIFKQASIPSFIFILGVFLFAFICFIDKTDENQDLLNYLIFANTIILGLSVFIKTYFDKKGYGEMDSQYLLMETIYAKASEKIDEIDNNSKISEKEKEEQMNELFLLVGREAVRENGNWYMVYKEKEPEVEGFS